ncbi:ATP-binding protein [Streptomyces nodosus]|uniref:ATP-binding protein n=1 Tax=Streptomyces nodosus TaxID=40318 RepID=UPI00345219F0
MSTNEVDAPARPAPSPPWGGLRGFADRWPFRRKLNVLVGVPLAVVAVLLAYLITDLAQQSDRAQSAARLVRDSTQVARLMGRVEAEHQQAILLSVRYEAAVGDYQPSLAAYRAAQKAVDAQVATVRATFGGRLPATENQALREAEGLAGLRETVEQGYLPADNIDPAYTNVAKGLIDGLGLDRNQDLADTFTGHLLDSLLRADAAHGSFETGVFSATTGDSNALIEFTGAVGAHELYLYQADRFARFATDEQVDELSGIEHNVAQREIAEAYAELQVDPSGLQAGTPAEVRHGFEAALAGYASYPKQADERLKITTSLIDQIADRADAASRTAQWRAGLLLGLTVLGFACWLAFSVVVRRSVVRPVRALTGAAQQVAEVAGRELSRVADDDDEDDGPPRLREVPVTAHDEIGELAEAFNHVQSTAGALLERQVLSRRNVAEMFGNVGRRVSNLTTRQLALIDAVERGETDPALLERLYSIDHIAVRLRRNADSLMLLAGIRETVLDSGPTALTNVVRAALGQIEGYQRVRLSAATEVMVAPDIIGDLTLMVAELLENAVAFSPADSPVEVAVHMGGEGAVISIADHGLGMSPERLTEENARLIRRERLDVMPTKVLGLFVVGTLARRWAVEVVLSRTPGGGVTATVEIPLSLLLTMSPMDIPEKTRSAESAGARTEPAAGASPASGPKPSGAGASGPRPSAAAVPDQVPSAATVSGPVPSPDTVSGRVPSCAAGEDPVPSSAARETPGAAPATGSATLAARPPAEPPTAGAPGALPRRVPRRGSTPEGDGAAEKHHERPDGTEPGAHDRAETPGLAGDHDRAEEAPLIPRPRTGDAPVTASSPTEGVADGPRPLRRRVRGATLRTAGQDRPSAPRTPRTADADEVRSALEEFEAAVERAHRDSTPRSAPHDTQDQNHLPEGAEQ